MNVNQFLADRYNDIIGMAKKICKNHHESEEVAHFVISQFIEKPTAQALVDRGEAMKFMSGMIHLSFHSSTSPYHTIYRQKGRVHGTDEGYKFPEVEEGYDYEKDLAVSQIEKILALMSKRGVHYWYIGTLFEMYLKEGNYSEISRQTGIPRNSISHAVEECKLYIREELKKAGINYE